MTQDIQLDTQVIINTIAAQRDRANNDIAILSAQVAALQLKIAELTKENEAKKCPSKNKGKE